MGEDPERYRLDMTTNSEIPEEKPFEARIAGLGKTTTQHDDAEITHRLQWMLNRHDAAPERTARGDAQSIRRWQNGRFETVALAA